MKFIEVIVVSYLSIGSFPSRTVKRIMIFINVALTLLKQVKPALDPNSMEDERKPLGDSRNVPTMTNCRILDLVKQRYENKAKCVSKWRSLEQSLPSQTVNNTCQILLEVSPVWKKGHCSLNIHEMKLTTASFCCQCVQMDSLIFLPLIGHSFSLYERPGKSLFQKSAQMSGRQIALVFPSNNNDTCMYLCRFCEIGSSGITYSYQEADLVILPRR